MLDAYSVHSQSNLLPLGLELKNFLAQVELLFLNMANSLPERVPMIQSNSLPSGISSHLT